MWNETGIPLGYLITFRCYGTWLHGDERGSIDRFHNRHNSPYIPPNKQWHSHIANQITETGPVILNAEQRENVESAIREVCDYRRWTLHAVNVRTNHVHVVTSVGRLKPELALNAFKAYATRKMRKSGNWTNSRSPWADKGSHRYLWTERSVELGVDYVVNGQGGPLPEFV
jgi:REP element-mobilizing transposase RayT